MLYALAMALCVIAIVSVLAVVVVKGSQYFWPTRILLIEVSQDKGKEQYYGQFVSTQKNKGSGRLQKLYKVTDWTRLDATSVFIDDDSKIDESESAIKGAAQDELLPDVALFQLRSGSQIFATPVSVSVSKQVRRLSDLPDVMGELESLRQEADVLLDTRITYLNSQLVGVDNIVDEQHQRFLKEFELARELLQRLQADMASYELTVKDASGTFHTMSLVDIDSYHFINRFSFWHKVEFFLSEVWEFVSESPKQLYASGGIFPAIIGTVVMVLLMTVFVTPLGVLVAIYLHEYATQNRLTTLIRISVNNLAGVPSIVYGVFGLSFFVYELGAGIDNVFYSEALPAPTFGAPGLFWASLTMAMLTLPVVVVATEEGLRRVPDSLRTGSYALGATQFEMIRKTVIPIASPGIMTGIILAIARGAGEVAPLILVGAVKFAPSLPVDSEYPFIHFERQFMHLGVTIFDGAFQGQLAGSGSNMMFAACLFLLLIVLVLNSFAVNIRHRLRRQYNTLEE
jgi:phosphate transport system permease protein